MNLSKLNATVYTDLEELSYRYDGNNVDIATETANLAENQIRYYTLLDSMTQEFSRIKTALTAKCFFTYYMLTEINFCNGGDLWQS